MESALLSSAASAISSLANSNSVNLSSISPVARLHCCLPIAGMSRLPLSRCGELSWPGASSSVLSVGYLNLRRERFQFAARSVAGGGGFGGVVGGAGGGGGGGDGAAEGGEAKPATVASGVTDDPALSSDVIVLDVGGMTCGGCAESVRKILESQPQVSSASVNLTTETAIVWPVSEVKAAPNWQKDIGEALAKHLTTCGFKSNLKDKGVDGNIRA